MVCPHCGADMPDGFTFCGKCGASLALPSGGNASRRSGGKARGNSAAHENAQDRNRQAAPGVYPGADGKYLWIYEQQFGKSPIPRRIALKLLGHILPILILPALPAWLLTGSDKIRSVFFLLVGTGIVLFLVILSATSIMSAFHWGSFWSIFEMDDRRIVQTQMDQDYDRDKVLSLLLALSAPGAADAAQALRTGADVRYEISFDDIRSVKPDPKHDLIECGRRFAIFPVYAKPEDYAFIVGHIVDHVPEKTAAKFRAKHR